MAIIYGIRAFLTYCDENVTCLWLLGNTRSDILLSWNCRVQKRKFQLEKKNRTYFMSQCYIYIFCDLLHYSTSTYIPMCLLHPPTHTPLLHVNIFKLLWIRYIVCSYTNYRSTKSFVWKRCMFKKWLLVIQFYIFFSSPSFSSVTLLLLCRFYSYSIILFSFFVCLVITNIS